MSLIENRIFQYQSKKKEICMDKMKKDIFYIHRWDIIREKRAEC